jgi:TolB-like protein
MSRIAMLCGLALLTATAIDRAWADSPTTRPAAAVAPAATVSVAPFQPLVAAPEWAWASEAVQQNLLADLARASFRTSSAAATGPEALSTARAAGAQFLVTGSYQWAPPNLRFEGQVVATSSGSVVGGLSVTGDGRDLFALEDDLSAQLVRVLTHAVGHPVAAPTANRPVPPALQPDAVAAAITPAAADGTGSAYEGSALQSYVNANQTPSVDYDQQLANARDRNTFGSYNTYGGLDDGGLGYGGFGYGGYGYAGYTSGGYLLGVSYPVAGGYSSFGYGGFGGYGFGYGGYGLGHGGLGGRGGFGGGFGGIGRLGVR